MKARRFCLSIAFVLFVLVSPAGATKMYPTNQDFEPDLGAAIPAERSVRHLALWLGTGVVLGLGLAFAMRYSFFPNHTARSAQ
ncbi:MAG: hypothetical protein ABMA02_05945 [Saprospiraceae bacterium]